jgi:casein kinase 1
MDFDAVVAVLRGLKNLKLNPNIHDTKDEENTDTESQDDNITTIEISSDSSEEEESAPRQPMLPKRVRLLKLTKRAGAGTDNLELSKLVLEFIQVLQMNSSRTLTREAFEFLDALHKQLADPSVFIVPTRYV